MDTAQAQAVIGDGSAEQYTIPVAVTPAKVTKEVLERALFAMSWQVPRPSPTAGNTQRTNNVTLAAKYMNHNFESGLRSSLIMMLWERAHLSVDSSPPVHMQMEN